MKVGKTIVELATEIHRQSESKRDFIASTKGVHMDVRDGADVVMQLGHSGALDGTNSAPSFPLTSHAHGQVAQRLDIPRKYYDRMAKEAPELLVRNVNTWLGRADENRMIRTLDGNVRAFLSDKYRPLENIDLAEAVLPVLGDLDVEIISSEITERRMYIKAIDKSVQRQLPVGTKLGQHAFVKDLLVPAITISNSEVGAGSLAVESGVWTEGCTNLAIMKMAAMRKYHVGARQEIGDEIYAVLSENTRRITDAAVWAQVRDIVKAAFEKARFDAFIDKLATTTERRIEGDPIKAVEVTAKHFRLNDGERNSVLRHLIEGGVLSQYGLFNAITRTAEDLDDYDRATELERLGGEIVELPKSDWRRIAEAGKQEELVAA